MFEWYKNGSPRERKTFWACFSGWALDTYDAQMFSFLLPTLMAVWQISKGEAGMLGTAALLSASLGGWIAGILSDRYGRVRILIFTICWFTAFGALAGFAQSYEQMLLLRTLQGLGFGGEWAVGAALMAEVIRPEHRGKALGFVQSGFAIGWALAAVVMTALLAYLPAETAWRVAFWVGVIPAMFVLFVRRHIKDPEIYRQAASQVTKKASLASAFGPDVVRLTLLGAMLVTGLQAAAYTIMVWLPTLMVQVRGLKPGPVVLTMLIMCAGAFAGFILTAYLADRFGRRPALLAFCLGAWLFTMLYMLVPMSPTALMLMSFPVGLFATGIFAVIGPFLSELFPTHIRTTCMGFSYNLGKSLGALSVAAVGVLSESFGLAQTIGGFCLVAYALAVTAVLLLPETRGLRLDAIDHTLQPTAPCTRQSPARPK
ncbi:4-methylmuconolactone transporter [Pseudomonas putida SJTE-1]|uniref:Putative MFS superfamily 4-methylmuconolactone transporter n=1 Tax=Pseudomonas putida ND6 TaxID=231023 RepID=I3V4P6_PSEPU|nr:MULTISPECIES: MFS transporter [Pseudomonas]AFK72717.1 putative MFS superfamily 4-methylmuconolactone transporter [Pseudomonas putida ND6]ANI03706.1 4-methylmuconolactone transporter [Pseudomonas putida SJTE-1]